MPKAAPRAGRYPASVSRWTMLAAGSPASVQARTRSQIAATPSSQVLSLPATQPSPSFQVRWSGTDGGAGVEDYTVYVKEDNGPATVWQANTTATSATFTGQPGKTYAFYSVARDQVGNREDPPATPDATTRVASDTTPPTTTAVPSPAPNAAGWNSANVNVALNAADNPGGQGVKEISYTLSGAQAGGSVVAGGSASVIITTEGETTITYFATDTAGNKEAAKTLVVRLDKTAPTLTFGAPAAMPNAAGWHKADVSIPFTPADALSGVAATTPASSPLVLTAEGAAVTGAVTVTDKAGNSASFTSPAVKLDKTAATTTAATTPAANAHGWHKDSATVNLTAADATGASGVKQIAYTLSGAQTGSGTITGASGGVMVTAEGATTITYAATDNADNQETAKTQTVRIDKTPPTLTGAPTIGPNADGWYKGDVAIAWSCSDNMGGSGIDGSCLPTSTITGEGAMLTATAMVSDKAGNATTATSPAVKIDRTPPTVAVTGVAEGMTYTRGSVPAAGCTTTDPLSGVATNATTTVTGGTPNGVGAFTATCAGAVDRAGNASGPVKVTYQVQYAFTGFFSPVANPPTVNTVNGGRTIPLTWRLAGVSAPSSMVSAQSAAVSCATLTGAQDAVAATTTGGTSFRYDAAADQFVYNWATESQWAGSCRRLTVTLDDGTTHVALFSFR